MSGMPRSAGLAVVGDVAHGFEFLCCGGHCGFDRGDFAQPACSFASWRRSMRSEWARGSMVAVACSESYFLQFEGGEELVPFLGAEFAVFLAGSFGSVAGDECPMVCDHVLGVDRGGQALCRPLNIAPNTGSNLASRHALTIRL